VKKSIGTVTSAIIKLEISLFSCVGFFAYTSVAKFVFIFISVGVGEEGSVGSFHLLFMPGGYFQPQEGGSFSFTAVTFVKILKQ
jgi:hypothetical protein